MMLSTGTGNQYLRPEYLTPLPTTLDSKKSPLALLAQTCSQIGADTSNAKLLQSTEKSKLGKSESSSEKSSPVLSINNNENHLKSSFKPYELISNREKTGSPEDRSSTSSNGSRVRTPMSLKTGTSSNGNGRCSSNQSSSSPRSSPSTLERKASIDSNKSRCGTASPSKKLSDSSVNSNSTTASSISSKNSPVISNSDLSLSSFKTSVGIPVTSPYLGGLYSQAPGLLPMDLMTTSIMSQQALKSGALSPYLSYARMKNSSGADSLVPVCRDPYCTGCGLNSHLIATSNAGKTPTTSSCPAGCVQCDHAGSKSGAFLSHNPAAMAYAHAQLAALATASQLPYVCNWVASDAAYCGKRFGTADELLQHLRTHTSLAITTESSAALSMLNSATMSPAHPLFHRTYPTPPLSPLATARFHPYSKPSLLPPSLVASSLASFPLGHPGLSPYFSPYSLYGPRLGAASTMHP